MTLRQLQLYFSRNGALVGSTPPIEPPPPDPDPVDPPEDPVDPPPAPGTWVFESSAMEGGRFQNVIAVSPFNNGVLRPYLIGGDITGVHRSVNRGATWTPASSGSLSSSARIAAIMWSALTPGKAFIAEDSGIHRTTDWGITYTRRCGGADVDWDANNDFTAPDHPRGTGYMLAQTPDGSQFWAGTRTKGLRRSTNEFSTFVATTMLGYPIRSIAKDPNEDVLYVSVNRGTPEQNGVWRVTNASTTMNATKMTSYPGPVDSPIGPEEVLAVVGSSGLTRIFVAGHSGGVYRYTPSADSWVAVNSGLVIGGTTPPAYRTVCSDPVNPDVVYCSAWHPSNRRAIWQSRDLGGTWTQITAPLAGSIEIDYTTFGTSRRWWGADVPYYSFAGPSSDWLAASLAIDPDITNRVLAVGRGSAWWGTLTQGIRVWQPAVHGLMISSCMAVEADGLVDGVVQMGSVDHTHFFSLDSMQNARQSRNPNSPVTGDVVTIDKSVTSGRGRSYYGASARGQNTGDGGIWSTTSPGSWNGTHWVDEVGTAFNSDVTALAVGKNGAGTTVILAGVSNPAGTTVGGLWRKLGSTWSKSRSTDGPFGLTSTVAASNMGVMRWQRGTDNVYALDSAGLWRSTTAGDTWIKILGGVSATYGTYDAIVLDPSNPAKLYLSSGGILRRVDNANTATGTASVVTVTIWSGTAQAGNLAINPDGSELFLNLRDGRLMRSTAFRTATTQTAAAWANIADPLFQRMSGNIRSMTCTPGGQIITADNVSGSFRAYRAA